jgi:hypothetical protein
MYKLYNVKAMGSMCVHFLLEEMEVPYTNVWMTMDQVRDATRWLSRSSEVAIGGGMVETLY